VAATQLQVTCLMRETGPLLPRVSYFLALEVPYGTAQHGPTSVSLACSRAQASARPVGTTPPAGGEGPAAPPAQQQQQQQQQQFAKWHSNHRDRDRGMKIAGQLSASRQDHPSRWGGPSSSTCTAAAAAAATAYNRQHRCLVWCLIHVNREPAAAAESSARGHGSSRRCGGASSSTCTAAWHVAALPVGRTPPAGGAGPAAQPAQQHGLWLLCQ
jgi:hypothetical protein